MKRLDGWVVAITGAAQGIGLATAHAFVAAGAHVAMGDLDGALASREAENLGSAARGYPLDVTDEQSFADFLTAAEAAFGRPLDVLVNNAGIMWVGPFADEPNAAAQRQFDVNVHGVIRGMKLALPGMRRRRRGQIVNVASAASKLPTAGEATYSATKHAVYGYSAAVRRELRGSGVGISVVMPVVVQTALAAGTSTGKGRLLLPGDVASAVVSAVQSGRFDVYVPRSTGFWARLVMVIPSWGRDALYRIAMPDQVRDADVAARATYQSVVERD